MAPFPRACLLDVERPPELAAREWHRSNVHRIAAMRSQPHARRDRFGQSQTHGLQQPGIDCITGNARNQFKECFDPVEVELDPQ